MGWARSGVLGLAMSCVTCGGSASPTPDPSPTPTFISNEPCRRDLGEVTGPGTVFPDALLRDGVACTSPLAYAEEQHCVGVYVAIAQGNRLLGGSARYFDGNRRLIALVQHTDYNAYCNGTAFAIIYGTVPSCPARPIVTDLCRR